MPSLISVQLGLDELRRMTRTNSVTLPDNYSASGQDGALDLYNKAYLDLMRVMALNGITVTGVIARADFTLNQTTFQFPIDAFAILRIDVNYNLSADPNNTQWKKATEQDFANLPDSIYNFLNVASQNNPQFFKFGSSIYPAPYNGQQASDVNSVQGIRLWYVRQNSLFTAGTNPMPWPFNFYYKHIAHQAASLYFTGKDTKKMEFFTQLAAASFKEVIDEQQHFSIEPIKTESVDYTNNGWQ